VSAVVRRLLAPAVKRGLLASGHYRRKLSRDRFPGVAVLCYHAVRPDDAPEGSMAFEGLHVRAHELEEHCQLIRKSCDPIRLSTWLDSGGSTLPRPVLVTFDDGYRSVFTLAKPILEKYEIPAVVFITSRPAIERRKFWYDEMAAALGEASVEEAKASPHREWSEKLAALPAKPVADDDPHAPLRPEEIRALAHHPLFEIGGHSSTHPILSRAEEDVQRREIEDNRRELESLAGVAPRAFAYPNGRPATDYDPTSVRLVREGGYEAAFTTRPGFSPSSESRWERSRFLMLAGISDAELGHRLSYSWKK
jgi:peptidoglycan/xylan/chitin deacetylase (PgdA/CDA1 family)